MNKIDVLLILFAIGIHVIIYSVFPQSHIIYYAIPRMLNIFYIPLP